MLLALDLLLLTWELLLLRCDDRVTFKQLLLRLEVGLTKELLLLRLELLLLALNLLLLALDLLKNLRRHEREGPRARQRLLWQRLLWQRDRQNWFRGDSWDSVAFLRE